MLDRIRPSGACCQYATRTRPQQLTIASIHPLLMDHSSGAHPDAHPAEPPIFTGATSKQKFLQQHSLNHNNRNNNHDNSADDNPPAGGLFTVRMHPQPEENSSAFYKHLAFKCSVEFHSFSVSLFHC